MSDLRRRADWFAHAWKATTQQHHRELVPVFAPYVAKDAVVFDVGAHAGQFSKLFAKLAPNGKVFAFEPSVYARSILKPALAWNRLTHVEIVPMGLSDADGELVLHTPIKRHGGLGFGLAHLGGDQSERPSMTQTVKLTTLDGFVASRGLTRLDFIKADVEGWESHILRGGERTLAAHHPAMFLEVVDSSLTRAGASPGEIWDRLTPLGYRALKAPDFKPVNGFAGDGDYLFVT
jgi:FkbM family methyltransferase